MANWSVDGAYVANQSGMLHLVQQPDGGVFSAAFRGLSIGILVLMTSIAVEGMAVATVMPTAAADLNGLEWYGWAFSAFMLASLVGAIGGGELADQRSPALAGQLALAVLPMHWPMHCLHSSSCCSFSASSSISRCSPSICLSLPSARFRALAPAAWVHWRILPLPGAIPSPCDRDYWRCCRLLGCCRHSSDPRWQV